MYTHNICFHGEIRKIKLLFAQKKCLIESNAIYAEWNPLSPLCLGSLSVEGISC